MKREWVPVLVTAGVVALTAALLPPPVGDDLDLTAAGWVSFMVILSAPFTVLLTALVAGSLRRHFLMTRDRPQAWGSAADDLKTGAAHGLAAATMGFVVGGFISQMLSGSESGEFNYGTFITYGVIAIIVVVGQGAGYLVGGKSARRLIRAQASSPPRGR